MRVTENRTQATSIEAPEAAVVSKLRKEATPAQGERVNNAKQLPRIDVDALKDMLVNAMRKSRREEAANNPTLSTKVADAKYGTIKNAELFGASGPSLRDIKQGGIGDCYFLAAVGSVVAENPEAIKDMIRDNKDGTYSVRFYHKGEPVWIHVDGQLPVDSKGNPVYAKGADSDGDKKLELWVPLMEKAYAKFKDTYSTDKVETGYSEIDHGGHCDTVMEALTGKEASRKTWKGSADQLADRLAAVDDGQLVSIGTKDGVSDGWAGPHAYTVLDTYEKDGETYVVLRNPWGFGEPDSADHMDNERDGIFTVTIDELNSVTGGVYTGEPPAKQVHKPKLSDIVRLVA